MIDFHSHVLPCMDDGSKSTEESIQMLSMLREQGVETVAATPHFYANQNTPEVFLRRRAAAWEHLRPHLTSALPHVLLGAEVHYFQGISRVNELQLLCLAEHACSATRDALFCLVLPHVGRDYRSVSAG